ncbi:hypothetical protein C2E20_3092 [Micractinium conductrix]|uniref:Uncharacterized protein n=1 Tax=Micractinium conductrix TaxID=554055 RepID=A0A2P6VIE0_9CHLO|nr:hypothetical protein C2E20_3092 [Micractinium conductrix]|eukprot:PSC73859.1 hypothetical protein C2E20_3092 [Micractinium conductrix]
MLSQRLPGPGGLSAPRRSCQRTTPRLGCRAAAGPQRRPVTAPKSQAPAPQLLAVLEAAAVAVAVGGHAAALITAHRTATAAAEPQQQQASSGARRGQRVAAGVASNGASPLAPQPSWLTPGSVWLTLPLVAALALGRLRAWFGDSSPLPTPGKAAVARVLRLEAAAGAQAEQLAALGGQLDKLSIRSRVVGRDIKLPLQQLQALAGQQAEVLVGVVQRMEKLEQDIKETEGLVEALQGVSAKQFGVLLKLLEGQKAAQQAAQQQQRKHGQQAAPVHGQQAAAPQRRQAPQQPAVPAAPRPASPQRADAAQGGQGGGTPPGTDEWGRKVVPLPQAPVVDAPPPPSRRPAADLPRAPPLPNAAPATAMSTGGDGGVLRPLGPSAGPSEATSNAEAAPAGGPRAAAAAAGAGAGAGAAGDDARKPGLGTESMLDILDSDPFFRAEREMIRTFVNQPKKVEKPEVEVLPPLWPQQQPEAPPESPAQRRQRQQVEEWRQRLARSMQVTQLSAALGGPPGDANVSAEAEQGSSSELAAGGAADEPVSGAGANAGQSSNEPAAEAQASGGTAGEASPGGAAAAAPPPGQPGSSDGVSAEQNDDGSTTYRF